MTCRLFLLSLVAVAALLLGWQGGIAPCSPALAETSDDAGYAEVAREVKALEEALAAKREELAKLRHRWVVSKGRVPTAQEIEDFEKKLAKGKAKPAENPYFNKNPLSSPAPARNAYYRKLEEVRLDEERLRKLRDELAALVEGR